MRQHIRHMLREGFDYRKAEIMLLDLAQPQSAQANLFQPATLGDERLMDADAELVGEQMPLAGFRKLPRRSRQLVQTLLAGGRRARQA